MSGQGAAVMLDIEVRSSGPGPRGRPLWTRRLPENVVLIMEWLTSHIGGAWPRDGVAVVIRRAS